MSHIPRKTLPFVLSLMLVSVSTLTLLPKYLTPAQAAFPGYNGKIAFYSNRDGNYEIYAANDDGSGLANLTNNEASDTSPVWSPDGTKIVFVSTRDVAQNEIYVMDADGDNLTRLTTNVAYDLQPDWSPDGLKIVFDSQRDGNREIYVMDADGGNQINLSNNIALDAAPAWSPDGSKIAFGTNRDGNNEIYVMAADGSNPTNLTNNGASEGGPSWSPDGAKIAFSSNRSGNDEVYVMDADGSNVTQLTNNSAPDNAAVWSSDGQKLLFTSQRDGNLEIYVMNSDGSNQVRLTNDAGFDHEVSWQPIPNTPPVLAAKSLSVGYQTTGSVDVLTGSTDEEELSGSNLSITVQPTHGTASVNATLGKVEYTPTTDYSGSDSLTYRICDSFMLDQKCSTAVLGITVAEPGAPILTISKAAGMSVLPGGTYTSNTNKPTFSGTASPNAQITVEIHSDPITLNATADGSGDWSVTADQALPPGNHTVTISATLNGKTTTLDSFVLGIQDEIPNTGANTTALRTIGITTLIAGGGLTIYRRRLSKRQQDRMPKLFP